MCGGPPRPKTPRLIREAALPRQCERRRNGPGTEAPASKDGETALFADAGRLRSRRHDRQQRPDISDRGRRKPPILAAAARPAARDRGRLDRRRGHGLAPARLVRDAGPPPRPCGLSSPRTSVAAVAAYIALYIVAVALSLPAAFYLTMIGGLLFGAVLGGAGGDGGRDDRGDLHLSHRPQRARRASRAPRRSAGGEARRGLPRRRFQLPAVPAAGADLSVLAGQSRLGAVRRSARDLRRGDRDRHRFPPPSSSPSSAPASTA